MFNPFDKDILDRITEKDLNKLISKEVTEGFFIEYKSQFPENLRALAKSIAAFANTYGGWLIIGVETDEHNTANNICGIDADAINNPISKIRDTTNHYINPNPLYHIKTVRLKNKKIVIIVHVSERQDTPFVFNNGVIYRREGDSSNPKTETDRYVIDKLFDDGKNYSKRFQEFCKDDRTMNKGTAENGWISIFISPYPMGLTFKSSFLREENIEKLFERSKMDFNIPIIKDSKITGKIPFTLSQTTNNSVIFIQKTGDGAFDSNVTVELFENGRAKLHIPVARYLSFNSQGLKSEKCIELLDKRFKKERRFSAPYHFFNIANAWILIGHLMSFYLETIDKKILKFIEFEIKFQLYEMWEYVPFIDFDKWAEYVEKFGLPVINKDKIVSPAWDGGYLFAGKSKFPIWLSLVALIGNACGFTQKFSHMSIVDVINDKLYENSQMYEDYRDFSFPHIPFNR